ncbi:hypothetical protein C5745_09770 [Sphingobacterium haloxyli]|uniref:Uncharacterized protein n=1 Tax=Sphingobacterium haloxyli TaxID=2100533 RepID=A0A2S9J482_9SPHI|nr:hypothetical protein C5745_09770 [Sphingobacterium haloxyli]
MAYYSWLYIKNTKTTLKNKLLLLAIALHSRYLIAGKKTSSRQLSANQTQEERLLPNYAAASKYF